MQIRMETLDNGMRVIATSLPSAQTIGISVGVMRGFVDDKKGKVESSHFLEHMLFKGTTKRTWSDLNSEFKELGVTRNAFTDYESTVYLMQGYRGYFTEMMDLMSDMIINSSLPEKEMHTERGPMMNELLIAHDNTHDVLEEYLAKLLFKKHPARNIANRSEKAINSIHHRDIVEIYRKFYGPRNMILSIYGGITANAAIEGAKRYFGGFEKDVQRSARRISTEKQERVVATESRKGIKQSRIGIGFKIPEFKKSRMKDYLSSIIIERLLDYRLFDEIREKRGLSYDPMADSVVQSTFGFIGAGAGVEKNKIDETKKIILKEFERLQNGEIEKKQFDIIKTGAIVEYTTSRENTLAMSISMTVSSLVEGIPELPLKIPKLLKSIKMNDLREFCGRYIDVDKYGMFILKPKA